MVRSNIAIALLILLLFCETGQAQQPPAGSAGLPKIELAGPPKPDSFAKSGAEARIGAAWDCNMPEISPWIWVRADHGTVRVAKGVGPACDRKDVHLTGIFYTSEPGFKGEDTVYVLGFVDQGQLDSVLHVQVK